MPPSVPALSNNRASPTKRRAWLLLALWLAYSTAFLVGSFLMDPTRFQAICRGLQP